MAKKEKNQDPIEPMDLDEIMESFDMNDESFSIETPDFDIGVENPRQIRFIKPPKERNTTYKKLKFKNAKRLAHAIDFQSLDRVFVLVDGSFIFGDFIEAFIIRHQINVTEMTLSTLSLNQDNVDSMHNLITKDYIQDLTLIVSDFFFAHERNLLIPYLYDKLDIDNKFQLAVCRTHCKVYQFKTEGGKHIVIHGSVNLRSSDNLEQFVIEDNKDLYDFNQAYFKGITERYKTINKSIKSRELWKVVKDS